MPKINNTRRNKSRRNKSRKQNGGVGPELEFGDLDRDVMIDNMFSHMTCDEIQRLRPTNTQMRDLIDDNIVDIFQMVVRNSPGGVDEIKRLSKAGKLNAKGFVEWCKADMEYRARVKDAEEYNDKYSCHECGITIGKVNYETFEYEHPDTGVVLCKQCYNDLTPRERRNWGLN